MMELAIKCVFLKNNGLVFYIGVTSLAFVIVIRVFESKSNRFLHKLSNSQPTSFRCVIWLRETLNPHTVALGMLNASDNL